MKTHSIVFLVQERQGKVLQTQQEHWELSGHAHSPSLWTHTQGQAGRQSAFQKEPTKKKQR